MLCSVAALTGRHAINSGSQELSENDLHPDLIYVTLTACLSCVPREALAFVVADALAVLAAVLAQSW